VKKLIAITLFLSIVATVSMAQEKSEFIIESGEVEFISKVPMNTFKGTTSIISGSFFVNPEQLSDEISGEIVVDVVSLDTGIKKRNKHMFDNHLHPEEYPVIVFEPNEVFERLSDSLQNNKKTDIVLKGNFILHGVTKEIESIGTVVYNSENQSLDVEFGFDLLLSDFEIPRPAFLVMKVSDTIKIKVIFKAAVN